MYQLFQVIFCDAPAPSVPKRTLSLESGMFPFLTRVIKAQHFHLGNYPHQALIW